MTIEDTGPETTAPPPAGEKPPTNPDDYTKDQLVDIAGDLGVDPTGLNKAELAEAIDAAGGPPTPEEEILLEQQAVVQEESDNFDIYSVEGTAEWEDRKVHLETQAAIDQAIADGTVEAPPGYVAPEAVAGQPAKET